MTSFDAAVLLILMISILAGARRGMVRGVVGIVSLLCGLYFATHYYGLAGEFLRPWVGGERASNLCGFAAVLSLSLLIGAFLAWSIRGMLRSADMTWLDRVFGAGFGFLRGWIAACIVYIAITAFGMSQTLVGGSVTLPYLEWGAGHLRRVASEEFTKPVLGGASTVPPADPGRSPSR